MSTSDLLKYRGLTETAIIQKKLAFQECSSEKEKAYFMKKIGLSTKKALNVFYILLRLQFDTSVDQELSPRASFV